ncbi:MAG TPA: type II secretion system protein [Tepidisphaeraceae bacterium]|nr:type II secretion system protein [Tepidisphaeraceae bacterium]
METLVLLGIIIVLLSIFIPYIQSIRETSKRLTCADNLRQIRSALQYYARDNNWDFPRIRYDAQNNPNGYTAFSGPDADNPFATDSSVQPNDVTASLWLLVRNRYVKDTRVFICPSTDGARDDLTNAAGTPVAPEKRGNFRGPSNLSYSYASPFSSSPGYRLKPDLVAWDFAVLADQNPGSPAAQQPFDAPMSLLSRANSSNHGTAGQNVVYGDSSVRFQTTPYCGVGYFKPPGDNIYTARAAVPTTQPTSMPINTIGFAGPKYAPVSNDDSYLVPTSEDMPTASIPYLPPTSAPATTSTSAPATTATAPATAQ